MKTKYIIPLLVLFPLTAYAKYLVDGTDNTDADAPGEVVDGNYHMFGMTGTGVAAGERSAVLGISDVEGEWWVGNNSGTPWGLFQDADGLVAGGNTATDNDGNTYGANTHPSVHITTPFTGGETFFVGLSMQHEMREYTSNFRITNDVLPAGTNIYFGLRNGNVPAVLLANNIGEDPIGAQGGSKLGYIEKTDNLTFHGSTEGGGITAPIVDGLAQDEFEWLHYTTKADDSGAAGTVFSLKTGGDLYEGKGKDKALPSGIDGLTLTDWVAYFVLPADLTTTANADGEIHGGAWGDTPLTSELDEVNDLVFSWTVDAKSGMGPQQWETPPDNEVFTVPEPSSVFLLFSGASLMLLRRSRKAA